MMPAGNAISEVSRRNLFDELRLSGVSWCGRLGEADFLGRVFDLGSLPSRDHRYADMAGDVVQHRERNHDWPEDWIFDDSRLNLLRGDDATLLRFLCEMVHPIVRDAGPDVDGLIATINRHLAADGFEIAPRSFVSGKAIYAGRKSIGAPAVVTARAKGLVDSLASDQVSAQITRMETSIEADPALAIGSAKEFVESLCKGILVSTGATLSGSETLPQLVKQVRGVLKLDTEGQTGDTLKRTLSALSGLTQGIAELRGQLGSGHGHHPSVATPDPSVARLAVGAATTLGVFLYEAFRNSAERPKW